MPTVEVIHVGQAKRLHPGNRNIRVGVQGYRVIEEFTDHVVVKPIIIILKNWTTEVTIGLVAVIKQDGQLKIEL